LPYPFGGFGFSLVIDDEGFVEAGFYSAVNCITAVPPSQHDRAGHTTLAIFYPGMKGDA
jgi:hypothetical protein